MLLAATRPHPGRPVLAVVTVRSGVSLPVPAPGGRVVAVLRHVGSEVVRAPQAALLALAGDPRVAGVAPDRTGQVLGHAYGKGKKSAGLYASQYLSTEGKSDGHGNSDLGRGVNVALLDTGVSDTAALNRASGRITDGVDVSQLSSGGPARTSGQFTDGFGHGTFLASLIAGGKVAGSDGNTLGVAPAARIVVVKVADDAGQTSLVDVLAGLDWVAAHARAIQVVNVALAVPRPTAPAYGADPLTAAVEHVRADGVLVVAAVGNTPGQVGDPGMDPQALTVGAADLTDGSRVASFSGGGIVDGVGKPDVLASGVDLLGLLPTSSLIARTHSSAWQPNGLFRGSGTSEATAVTSGVAAVWFSRHPGGAPGSAKTALRAAAIGGGSRDVRVGAGLVQLQQSRASNGSSAGTGEAGFDAQHWQREAWLDGSWESWLAQAWSGPAWDASSWSASTWSASSWSSSSWSASSWSASSWSASSWSSSSWSSSSWSASSWSDYAWGDDG
jgi:serine protease AprX